MAHNRFFALKDRWFKLAALGPDNLPPLTAAERAELIRFAEAHVGLDGGVDEHLPNLDLYYALSETDKV